MKTLDANKLNQLLEEVTSDVAAILAKSEQPLAKADPGEEAPGEETPSGSSAEGSAPEGSASPEAPEGSPEGSPGEGPEGSPGDQGAEGAEPGAEQTQDPAQVESAGPEALVAEYAKLPIEELKIHVMASHAALMQAIGGEGGVEGAAGGPGPEGAPGEAPAPEGAAPEATTPPGEAPAPEEPQMGKKEIKASEGNGGKIMKKSETDTRIEKLEKSLADKDKVIADLETKFTEAAEGLKRLIEKSGNTAMRKSLASVSFAQKPGDGDSKETVTLSKSEAVSKLNALTSDREKLSKLSKSDRENINRYVVGDAPQSTVAHLLK